MTTIPEQIRAYIQAQLIGNTLAGSQVFDSRVDEFQDSELPAINIWMIDESLNSQSSGYSAHSHKPMSSPVDIVFSFNVGPDDNAGSIRDQFKKQIKDRLDSRLGGNATDCEYQSTQTFVDTEGDRPRVTAAMTFNVEFIDS